MRNINLYSLRIKLDDVISDKDNERIILENIKQCRLQIGKGFRLILWHENLSLEDCQKFVQRNEKILFEINTRITKSFFHSWFVIYGTGEQSTWRYVYYGDILPGLVEYKKLVKTLKKMRDNYEDRDSR
tara:strand:+ start:162 stop:548 length:387 start_codon:yes stop_codon:yes gene_type:complete